MLSVRDGKIVGAFSGIATGIAAVACLIRAVPAHTFLAVVILTGLGSSLLAVALLLLIARIRR